LANIAGQKPTLQTLQRGGRGGKNSLPDEEKPCRVGDPAPTLHHPALPCTLPPLQGGAGYLQGTLPCTYLADKDGQKPLLGGGVQGLQGGFSGE
jgi:hypothetical protein